MKTTTKDSIVKALLVAVFLLVGLLGIPTMCNAQSFVKKGNNFEQVSTRNVASTATKTKFTWTDTKGNTYPIYVTKTGRCFVNKISSKTNKEYKYYLKEDLSRAICKELGIIYQEKAKK